MRAIYSLLFYIALPFIVLRLIIKGKKNQDYNSRIPERFGCYAKLNTHPADIWLHAVSLGESIAAKPLIKELLQNHQLVVTTTTPTGSRYIQEQFGNTVQHVYLPYDTGCAIKAFIRTFQPKKLIIMETELWPNIIHFCHKAGISISIVNARISDSSIKQYLKFKNFFGKFLRQVNWIGAQSENDKERFIAVGARRESVELVPNIKFAATISPAVNANVAAKTAASKDRPIWIAGSTHENEDIKVLAAHQQVLSKFPNALLILVPRHLNRCDAIIDYANSNNLKIQRSSSDTLAADTNIWLVDQMGVLQEYYKLAPIAFVGGSLCETGGHNLLEPVRVNAMVMSGPTLHNFRKIRDDLLEQDALIIVNDEHELAAQVISFLENNTERTTRQQRGAAFIANERACALKPILEWVAK